MVSTEIRLITFFVVEDGEAVYSQRKQELELTVAILMATKNARINICLQVLV